MAFIDTRIATGVDPGVRGGPQFATSHIITASGQDTTTARWATPKGVWDVSYGAREAATIEAVKNLFMAAKGKLHTFRYKDWGDYKSCALAGTPAFGDQAIGTGNGSATNFQLTKTYTSGGYSTVKTIYLPVSGTVKVGLAGVNQASGWSVNTTTGIVTFNSPPGNGVAITAGFEFDHEVRFDSDQLEITVHTSAIAGLQIGLVEHVR